MTRRLRLAVVAAALAAASGACAGRPDAAPRPAPASTRAPAATVTTSFDPAPTTTSAPPTTTTAPPGTMVALGMFRRAMRVQFEIGPVSFDGRPYARALVVTVAPNGGYFQILRPPGRSHFVGTLGVPDASLSLRSHNDARLFVTMDLLRRSEPVVGLTDPVPALSAEAANGRPQPFDIDMGGAPALQLNVVPGSWPFYTLALADARFT